ncbi:hypothetical protein BGW36DRAFT_440538 [Talaromyces proteolyticus]|uniref:Uncharacterized protein n=1 Tax=Talaromyces proteolyticus TaxID=1131652 RepID=A0AAD4PUU7_9EURO|nr:uncharacterized protein BGW36DRAFT_440538 [Talaromyces proteolyticus]KAH8689846.1 hypothetical protein BGW36DRAFT_440538 [Talaromyces proteolyticus]
MNPNLHWSQSSISADFDLIPRASISAVSWNADPSPISLNLQVRILSFKAEGGLIAMSYDQNNDGWDDNASQVAVKSTKATIGGTSAVAAVQGLDADDTRHMDVFYQPVAMIGQLSSKTTSFDNPTSFGMGVVILDDAERRRMQLVDGHDAQYWKNAYELSKTGTTNAQFQLKSL